MRGLRNCSSSQHDQGLFPHIQQLVIDVTDLILEVRNMVLIHTDLSALRALDTRIDELITNGKTFGNVCKVLFDDNRTVESAWHAQNILFGLIEYALGMMDPGLVGLNIVFYI